MIGNLNFPAHMTGDSRVGSCGAWPLSKAGTHRASATNSASQQPRRATSSRADPLGLETTKKASEELFVYNSAVARFSVQDAEP